MEETRVLLLDDHTLFRSMLAGLLETYPALTVVAHCGTVNDALAVAQQQPVDLILLDYDLGNQQTGFDFIRAARAQSIRARILLLTAGTSEEQYLRLLGFGVSGIFLKHSSPELLSEAIDKVMHGETWIDAQCLTSLLDAVGPASAAKQVGSDITARELEVLRGVFEGLSNKQIATRLAISETAVKSALQQLFSKTGVRTRSQLVRIALEEYASIWDLRLEPRQ